MIFYHIFFKKSSIFATKVAKTWGFPHKTLFLLAIASKNYGKREEKAHFVSEIEAYEVRERGSAIGEAI